MPPLGEARKYEDFYKNSGNIYNQTPLLTEKVPGSNFNSIKLLSAIVFKFITGCFMLFVYTSCDTQKNCEDYTKVPLRIGFYSTDNNQATRIRIDSLTVFGLGNDSILYDNVKNISTVELPLDPSRDGSAFVFVFPEINDTLWLFYNRRQMLISVECGFMNYYELQHLEHTGYLIRRAQITQSSVTNNLDEHIRIFPLITDHN